LSVDKVGHVPRPIEIFKLLLVQHVVIMMSILKSDSIRIMYGGTCRNTEFAHSVLRGTICSQR